MWKKRWSSYWQSTKAVYPDGKQFRLFIFTLLIGLGISIVALQIFLELAEALREELLNDLDSKVSAWIMGLRQPLLTRFVLISTELGGPYIYPFLIAGITWYTHKKERGWNISIQVLIVLTTTALLNVILKFFINRTRPEDVQLIEAAGLSFPSGHSMGSMAFYGFIIYLIWLHFRSPSLKIGLSVLMAVIILLIGFTRIYLGVHYPSDVAAGFAAGLSWLAICIWIFNWLNHRRLRKIALENIK